MMKAANMWNGDNLAGSRRPVAVGTTKMSAAMIWSTWFV